jgi:3-oxoacyl-[acyl-carrier-protein] synthase III
MVDTSDEWIVTRTGIRERRIAALMKQWRRWASTLLKKRWKWQAWLKKISG